MEATAFADSFVFAWIILPLAIFLSRIIDVSLQTARIVFVSKGYRHLAPLLGFFEVLIWLIAIGQVMKNLDNVLCYLAYAGGFAAGNYVGIRIENRLAIGCWIVRIIRRQDASQLIEALRECGYGVTALDAQGSQGPVNVIYTLVRRSDFQKVGLMIRKYNPRAFYSVEDVRLVSEGIFPLSRTSHSLFVPRWMRRRKGK